MRTGLRLFLCGDVMPGRGLDQVLPHSVDPGLYEPWVRDARSYVRLAEAVNGPIDAPLSPADVWGDALAELELWQPDVRMINLETAITARGDPWPGKGIHYRMHPGNTALLCRARIDVASLANNHVLDWGYCGLEDTLDALADAGVQAVGAGRDRDEAARPAAVDLAGGGRLLVLAACTESSGVPPDWAATSGRGGVERLPDLSTATLRDVASRIDNARRPGDRVLFSIHWGGNWGYDVTPAERRFAGSLVDQAGVDIVHGHSSHHPRPLQIHHGRPLIFGCGDFINDYEGIGGHAEYRPDLVVMYFPDLDRDTGELRQLVLVPMRIAGFRLQRADRGDAQWLADRLDEHGAEFGVSVDIEGNGGRCRLVVRWAR